MSRRSVRAYVSSLLGSLTVPGASAPITWYDYEPKNQALTDTAYIKAMSSREARDTLGGLGKRKRITHTVTVTLLSGDPDESVSQYAIDDIHEQVARALRYAPVPIVVTDTVTGLSSTLIYTGENIRTQRSQDYQLEAQLGLESQVATTGVVELEIVEEIV